MCTCLFQGIPSVDSSFDTSDFAVIPGRQRKVHVFDARLQQLLDEPDPTSASDQGDKDEGVKDNVKPDLNVGDEQGDRTMKSSTQTNKRMTMARKTILPQNFVLEDVAEVSSVSQDNTDTAVSTFQQYHIVSYSKVRYCYSHIYFRDLPHQLRC